MCRNMRKEKTYMNPNKKLLDEIVECAGKIPLECQERVLDVVKAMAYTREVVEREKEEGEKEKSR